MSQTFGAGRWRGHRISDFQELMRRRVENVLLVSSPYDFFILEEDGQLGERLLGEFIDLGLRHTPLLTRVSTGGEALQCAAEEPRFNLIITTIQLGDMNAAELARQARQIGLDVPVVLLAYDTRELAEFAARNDMSDIDRVFVWQGDVRILLAIVKYVEDKFNAPHDCGEYGVPLLIVVEDNALYYSSFLPAIYTELVRHSQSLIAEGVNRSHKILRMRARPKVLLASSFEEAWDYFSRYQDCVLGIISDVEFPMDGVHSSAAGAEFARRARAAIPDVPIVLQSSRPTNAALAAQLGAAFLLKGSPTLMHELRRALVEDFSFGDFVFRLPDGTEVARARDLRELEEALATVPAESIGHHGERNHFSKWLRARTEFALAHRLRPRRVSDYADLEELRRDLIDSIAAYREDQGRGAVSDFDRASYDGGDGFYRLGGGSLGGKARGLAFVRRLLADYDVSWRFPSVNVGVPPTVVVGTDVFDRFLEENDLRDFVMHCADDDELRRRILAAPLPEEARTDLAAFVEKERHPLAVRSSSLLEDSQYQPFTGVYETYMLANNHHDAAVRLEQLERAIKGVYASTFTQHAKAYLRATPYRLEEEKMAVILQRIVGARRGPRFYPDFSGVARSYNFYPTPPLASTDGIVAVALGLGRTVVDGLPSLRFCPRFPRHIVQFSSVNDMLENSQREFWALQLDEGRLGMDPDSEMREAPFDLDVAEQDGTLTAVGSTYSPENDAVYDGISRPGVRLVSFALVLKHGLFPLAELLDRLLAIGAEGMGGPVELEFAVNLRPGSGRPPEFGFLQMRPLALSHEGEELDFADVQDADAVCRCANVLGNGRIDGIYDLVVVDRDRFDRAHSREAAQEVARLNARLLDDRVPYVLVGVGRWGSTDPWLGVPVTWDQIAGARAIVESGFKDFRVTPSQGTHFFQNLTSFQVGYFTINPSAKDGFVDWDWLTAQPTVTVGEYVRHVRLTAPLSIRMNGKRREGVILKPREAPRP